MCTTVERAAGTPYPCRGTLPPLGGHYPRLPTRLPGALHVYLALHHRSEARLCVLRPPRRTHAPPPPMSLPPSLNFAGIQAIAGGYIDQANMPPECLTAADDTIDDGTLVAHGKDTVAVENAARVAMTRPFLLALPNSMDGTACSSTLPPRPHSARPRLGSVHSVHPMRQDGSWRGLLPSPAPPRSPASSAGERVMRSTSARVASSTPTAPHFQASSPPAIKTPQPGVTACSRKRLAQPWPITCTAATYRPTVNTMSP